MEWRAKVELFEEIRREYEFGVGTIAGVAGRGFAAADSIWSFGSMQRVQMLSGGLSAKKTHSPASVVAVMNRAATQDVRAVMLVPDISAVLAGTTAPTPRDAQLLSLLRAWRASGASRLDRALDGAVDDPGAAIMDAAWPRIARAVMTPVLGPLVPQLEKLRPIDSPPHTQGNAYGGGWYGYVDKDLRGQFANKYCGAGDATACSAGSLLIVGARWRHVPQRHARECERCRSCLPNTLTLRRIRNLRLNFAEAKRCGRAYARKDRMVFSRRSDSRRMISINCACSESPSISECNI